MTTAGHPLGPARTCWGSRSCLRPRSSSSSTPPSRSARSASAPIKKVPTLRGKTVINLFFEASTRTRSSFEIAEKRLSADNLNFSTSGSALEKGESLIDTALNLQAMAPDLVVIRHGYPGAPHMLAKRLEAGVINAGDGAHEHPTQALLDAFTIRRHKRRLAGLRVAIIGDIEHSRVVRSNIHLLTKMGATVVVGGPRTLMPAEIEKLGVEVAYTPRGRDPRRGRDHDAAHPARAAGADGLPLGARVLPALRPHHASASRLAKEDVIVMHPGPMNRGVEIASERGRRPLLGDPRAGHARRRGAHGGPLSALRRARRRGVLTCPAC